MQQQDSGGLETAAALMGAGLELCIVCGDRASGRHYGAISCEGCKGFFKRSIRKKLGYQCRGTMNCEVTKHHRNRCQFCRLQKCLACGMRSDSVQHERKPVVERRGAPNGDQGANVDSDSSAPAASNASEGGLLKQQAAYASKLFSLAAATQGRELINAKEEPMDTFGRNSPTGGINLAHLGLAAAFNKGSTGFAYGSTRLASSPSSRSSLENAALSSNATGLLEADTGDRQDVARQTRLLLQSQLAKNFMQMGGLHGLGTLNLNEYLQSAYGPGASDIALALSQHSASVREHAINEDIQYSDTEGNLEDSVGRWAAGARSLIIPPPPRHLRAHALCEAGSRLLMLCCHWPPALSAYRSLSPEMKLSLLRSCWSELFVLGLSQSSQSLSLSTILPSLMSHLHGVVTSLESDTPYRPSRSPVRNAYDSGSVYRNRSETREKESDDVQDGTDDDEADTDLERAKAALDLLEKLQIYIETMNELQVDEHEYACLRALSLFGADVSPVHNRKKLWLYQQKYVQTLRNNIQNISSGEEDDRLASLLLQLPPLRSFSARVLEEIFFEGFIGELRVDDMLPYLLRSADCVQ